MTAPSKAVRAATYKRDRDTCVALSNECFGPNQWNHRASSGHGGRGSKAPTLTVADGVTLCASHNERLEHDLYREGLERGWKTLRNTLTPTFEIPYYANDDNAWYLPLDLNREHPLVPLYALELLDAAGSLRVGVVG